MAVHLIIDGYNLIGSDKGLAGDLLSKRRDLVRQLEQYRERMGYPITVVFDGWRSGGRYEVEERSGGIRIIYSRIGEKADSVIQRLARGFGSGCVVVTSDREVRRAVEASGAVAVYAGEFGSRLKGGERELAPDKNNDDAAEAAAREKRGNPRRLSKKERKRRERLRKL